MAKNTHRATKNKNTKQEVQNNTRNQQNKNKESHLGKKSSKIDWIT